jgi:arsenite methyltransferase
MTELSQEERAPEVRLDLDSPLLAKTYDEVSTRQFEHGKILIGELAIRPGERVLDVGCGTGRLGDYVARLVAPSGEVVGLDPLPLRIELAAQKHPLFHASVGRAEDLSQFAAASFDVVYLNSVFHWVEDKALALAEIARVLKPGGRLGVNSADAERPHQSGLLVREVVVDQGLDRAAAANALGTNHRISAGDLRRLLESAGFTQVQLSSRTFVDSIADVDDLVNWTKSSSFGNFLSDLSSEQVQRVKWGLAQKLERYRRGEHFQLERYLVFATAVKKG